MSIINGVGRIGIRSYVAPQQITTSTLLNSLYSVWNADTLGTSLDTSIVGVWNAEASNNATVKNAWNANGNAIDSKSGANGTIVVSNGTTGTMVGTMSFGTGKLGSGAFTFNGSNFIQLPADTFNFTGDFSVSMWVYIPSTATSDPRYASVGVPLLTAFDNKNGYTTYRGWGGLSWYGNRVSFDTGGYSYGGSQVTSVSATMSSMNQWVHIVGTRKYASTTTLYINGVKMSQANITYVPTYNTNNLATIGGSSFAFSNPWFKGTIAGVKIDAVQTWNGSELDQAAVTELYNSGAGQEYPFTVSNVSIVTFNDSVGSNNGTSPVGSVPTFTTGKVGQAFTFDGVNDYIQLPSNSLNFTGDFSISGWAYFPTNYSGSSPMYILSNWNVPSWYTNPNGYFLRAYGNEVAFGIFNNGTAYTVTSSYVFQNNTMPASWHHIAATRKGSASSKLYIDGVLVASNTSTINPTYLTTTNPTIGAINVPGNVGSYPAINGSKIDSVSVWNKTLSDDEIVQLYNAGNGTQYPFSSQTLPSTKNQFAIDNGTLMNGCTLTDGKIGKAFTFDGVNDYIDLPNNSMNFTGDFSVSGWINQSSIKPYHMIIGNQGTSTGNWYGWLVWVFNNKLTFDLYNGNSAVASGRWQSTSTLDANTWIHFTITKKPNQAVKIYLNGVINGGLLFGSNSANVTYTTTNYATIGLNKYSNTIVSSDAGYWNGKIDTINVWQKELTQAEVIELYNSGTGKQLTIETPIVTNGLVLNLDAGRKSSYPNTGTTWYDISGNGKNGTLTNGPIFGTANDGSISFDGINDCVDFGDVLDMGTKSYTINMWIKLNSNSSIYQSFLSKALANQQNYRFAVGIINYNKLYAFLQGNTSGSDVIPIGTISLPLNTWFMATFIFDRSSSISIYYNGVNDVLTSSGVISQWSGLDFQSNNPFRIGSYTAADNSTPIGTTSGLIGTTQVYDRVLSQAEITQNFNATKSRFGL